MISVYYSAILRRYVLSYLLFHCILRQNFFWFFCRLYSFRSFLVVSTRLLLFFYYICMYMKHAYFTYVYVYETYIFLRKRKREKERERKFCIWEVVYVCGWVCFFFSKRTSTSFSFFLFIFLSRRKIFMLFRFYYNRLPIPTTWSSAAFCRIWISEGYVTLISVACHSCSFITVSLCAIATAGFSSLSPICVNFFYLFFWNNFPFLLFCNQLHEMWTGLSKCH